MYKSLQGGRAIAAIMVVLFHLAGAIAADKYFGIKEFAIPFSFGHSGVPFFFVLSGFIIFTAHKNDIFKPIKLRDYIWKRIIRIYPTYWIIFFCVFFMALSSSTLRNTVPHDFYTIIKTLILIPQDPSIIGGTGSPVLGVAWTLQYEMVFYLFFSALIINRILSIFLAISIAGIYLYKLTGYMPNFFILNFISSDYILLFCMGVLVAFLNSSRLIINRPIFFITAGTLTFIFIALNEVINIKLSMEIILYGLSSSLLIFGLVRSENSGRIFIGDKKMQLLGDSSYALYLIHYPLISVMCKLSIFLGINKIGFLGALFSFVFIFIICIFFSIAFHLRIEKPVTRFFREFLANKYYFQLNEKT